MAGRVSSVGRNEPCPCGSGKKYKRCHGATEGRMTRGQWLALGAAIAVLIGGLIIGVSSRQDTSAQIGVWSPEHNHYH